MNTYLQPVVGALAGMLMLGEALGARGPGHGGDLRRRGHVRGRVA